MFLLCPEYDIKRFNYFANHSEGGFIYMLKQTIANHSEPFLLKLDIQFFGGEEDAILPDDYVANEANPFEEEVDPFADQVETETELDTIESEEVDTGQEEQSLTPEQIRFKVKYNHEEQELGYDDAIPLIQKGMNYDKQQERIQQLESDPRMSFVEELASEQGMEVNEYLEAFRSHREETKLQELVQQNIPEEYAREMLESRKYREQQKAEQKTKEEEATKNKDFGEFFEYFKQANDRDFNSATDKIPQEVWDLNAQGVPIKFAYMQHHSNELRTQLKTLKQNEQNTKRAPIGSLTTYGGDEQSSEDAFMRGFNS